MKMKRIPAGEAMVLELSGKIMGGPSHDQFKNEIKEILESGHKNIVLDFGSVPWINSTGLGILISGYHSIRAADGRLKICNVKERVLSIFYISQLEKIFEVHESREAALASFE